MPSNPRNKSAKSGADKEKAVTDTTTDEAPASEAPATEAPAAPKVTAEQHEANLYNAIVAFGTDGNVETLQAAYREVPAAARGKVQGVAMKRAMTEGGVDMDALGSVLDAFNNLPAATKSRTSKPSVDEPTLAALRLAGLMVAYAQVQADLGDLGATAHEQAQAWYANGAPEEHTNLITKIASNVVTASQKGGRGGGGTRQTMTEKVSDLIARGALAEGAVLKGAGGVEATVNADGSITTNGESFDNLSAAARVHRTKDGKATSTNGWDFWQFDGKPVGELRKS